MDISDRKILEDYKKQYPDIFEHGIVGQTVPHAHIHLVPIFKISDLNFANAKPTASEDLALVAAKIRTYLK